MLKHFADKNPVKELICSYFNNKPKTQKTTSFFFFSSITKAASGEESLELWFHNAATRTCVCIASSFLGELLTYLYLVLSRDLRYFKIYWGGKWEQDVLVCNCCFSEHI